MDDDYLEMAYEDRYYLPDDDDYQDNYDLDMDCLDCGYIIDEEGLCECKNCLNCDKTITSGNYCVLCGEVC